ncbi:MAG: hypothetical protein J1F23_07880 [Oscillospiraceae bacterium]|nr:hypothetical protein [Oscillospiraceae bacterium]
MFGYVTVFKPELKIKEFEAYKGVYCTLCKKLGKEYGVLSRLLLSYDGAFFVIYKLGLNNEKVTAEKSRCTFNPCKKCCKIGCSGDTYSLAAAITVILSYFKLIDNIHDGGIILKILLTLIRPYFSFIKRRAKKKYPDIFAEINKLMRAQLDNEMIDNVLPDKAADASANMLSFLLSYGETGENTDFSRDFGYQLGRAVYFLDAFDDYEKDIKSNSFNPFKNSKNFVDDATVSVRLSIGELTNKLGEKSFNNFSSIVDNIIRDGLDFQLEKIVQKYRSDNIEQSI